MLIFLFGGASRINYVILFVANKEKRKKKAWRTPKLGESQSPFQIVLF